MNQQRPLIMRDLTAAVGEVMLYWGQLEGAMTKALGETEWSPGIIQRWRQAWRPDEETMASITAAAEVRNMLAHGLCGADARPNDSGKAHVLCRGSDGALRRITLDQLRDTAQRIDLLRIRIGLR